MARLIVIEPSLRDRTGHHDNAVRAVADRAMRSGFSVEVIGHRNYRPPAGSSVNVMPHFPLSVFDLTSADPIDGLIEDYQKLNSAFLDWLTTLPVAPPGPSDLVFFPTITPNQLGAIGAWLTGLDPACRPATAVMLMFSAAWHPSGRPQPRNRMLYRMAFSQFPGAGGARLAFGFETAALETEFRGIGLPSGAETFVAPLPVQTADWVAHGRRLRADADVGNGTLAYLGNTRPEKGFRLLPDILQAVRRRAPDRRFFVQVNAHVMTSAFRETRAALDRLPDPVIVHDGPLTADAYLQRLVESACLLLPYDLRSYGNRGSGLVTEACTFGIPVVGPNGAPFMEPAEVAGLAVGYEANDADAIAECIAQACAMRVKPPADTTGNFFRGLSGRDPALDRR